MEDIERRQTELFHKLETKLQGLITSVENLTVVMTSHNAAMVEVKAWEREHDISHAYDRGSEVVKNTQALTWRQVSGIVTALSIVAVGIEVGLQFLGL